MGRILNKDIQVKTIQTQNHAIGAFLKLLSKHEVMQFLMPNMSIAFERLE